MLELLRNEKGATTLEFGFIAVPLITLTMGIIEFAVILFINSSLESGVIQASRYAITGQTTPGVSREEKVLEILNQHGYGLVTIQPTDVTTLVYPNFASIGQPEPYADTNANGSYDQGEPFTDTNGNGVWDSDMGVVGLGGPGDIVVYKVDYQWGLLSDLLKPVVGDLTFTSGVAVRNEPY
jgi:hypothetical protein